MVPPSRVSAPRRATLADCFPLLGLIDREMRGVDSAYTHLTRSPWRRWIARYVTLPLYFGLLNEGWLLEADGQVAAWLFLLHHRHSTHVNDLGVHPRQRRAGLGRRLLAWAEQRAQQRAVALLTLAVTVANQPAVRLYERAAFQALHHHEWQGSRDQLPTTRTRLAARELDGGQRDAPFDAGWAAALRADGLPAAALLADQRQGWATRQGMAWELTAQGQRVGYADWVGDRLRLLLCDPHDGALAATAWATLRRYLPAGPLRLDLGSAVADSAAAPLLAPCGWQRARHERMLMAKQIGYDGE